MNTTKQNERINIIYEQERVEREIEKDIKLTQKIEKFNRGVTS